MKKYWARKKEYTFLALIAVFFIFFSLLVNYSVKSIDNKNTTVVVDIPTGSSFLKITEILSDAGIVKNRVFFCSLAVFKAAVRSIRAGEYEFRTSMTPSAVIDKLRHGEIKIYKVTIPEDLSVEEIAGRLKEFRLIDEETFFKLAEDKEFLSSMGIVADSVEGYLFPETYYLDRSMNTRQIMKIIIGEFWKKVTPEMIEKAKKMGFSVHEFVTLASIIGKESGEKSEKPLISAVFHNRLKRKMPLQSDPTAVYDLSDFQGKVLRSHLQRKSPYNTYLILGLPPGPIANPGLDSLQAAINPAPVDYLYFVSKRDGSHFFSSSLAEHNSAKHRYRLSKRNN